MKRVCCGAALLLALALPVRASTFVAMSQEEMVEQAGAVVTGRVVQVHSFWNREHTAILTEAVIAVEESILGNAGPQVRVRTFGGQVGEYKLVALGFPTFEGGEKLLLFLTPQQDGVHKVLGYRQGQFHIRAGASGRPTAVPAWEADTMRVLTADGTPARVPRAVALDELKLQIRQTAGRIVRSQDAQ